MSASLIFLLYRCSLSFLSNAYLASGALYSACRFRSQVISVSMSDCRSSLAYSTVEPFFLKDCISRDDSFPFSLLVCQSSREQTAEGEQKKLVSRAIPPNVSLLDLVGETLLQVCLVSLLCFSPQSSLAESSRNKGTYGISRMDEALSCPLPADSNNSSRFYCCGTEGQRAEGSGASQKASFMRNRYSWCRSKRSCHSCIACNAERYKSRDSTPDTALSANSCILIADVGGEEWKCSQVAARKSEATAAVWRCGTWNMPFSVANYSSSWCCSS